VEWALDPLMAVDVAVAVVASEEAVVVETVVAPAAALSGPVCRLHPAMVAAVEMVVRSTKQRVAARMR
jgi:hypothetical protein